MLQIILLAAQYISEVLSAISNMCGQLADINRITWA